MNPLLNSVPGDIPGLLRRGSPVLVTVDSARPAISGFIVEPHIEPDEIDLRCLVWTQRTNRHNTAAMFVALDLTDPTGRAHAAWWCNECAKTFLWPTDPRGEDEAVMLACLGANMTPTQIDTLARLVLRLAGRSP